ncbi:MAG: ferritin-like domain-containing protein [Candidatus Verstraetearchaeota archaeon]|nr:ferritin-like domain-containing protein [Candidatus Verstraetearchaeota archaeon]
MASQKLLEMLNEAASRELQVSIQYIWQHVMCRGMFSETISEILEKIAIEEMKHYEAIAERIDYLGGVPTTRPSEVKYGKNIKEMLEIDKKDEEGAISLYKKIIEVAESEKDIVTKKLFEDILEAEEEHHYKFSTLLETD